MINPLPHLLFFCDSFPSAQAASYVVNTLLDTSIGFCSLHRCSLRDAIIDANASAGADTITFNVSGTIELNSILPQAAAAGGALTIDGGEDIVIDGGGTLRLMSVQSGASLTLMNLTLQDGRTTNSGAGIYSSGTLTLENHLN